MVRAPPTLKESAMPAPNTAIENLRTNRGGDLQGQLSDWSGHSTVDYAFLMGPPHGTSFGTVADGIEPISPKQANYARLAFDLWDDVVPLSIRETDHSPDIRFAYSSTTSDGGTYTEYQSEGGHHTDAWIWMNTGWGSHDEDSDFFFGSYGLETYLHEIGHSLGLTHPGPYDASDSVAPTFSSDRPYDTQKYTVMSYFSADADGSGTHHSYHDADGNLQHVYASTPLLHDIAAMQAIYGVDTATRATDHTVYGFHSNAGKVINGESFNPFSFDENPNPVFCIWDAGGDNDTIDASGFAVHQYITLEEGAFSSISKSGGLTDNISIAFGARIENAIGGSGNDEIHGNDSNNILEGGGGNDTLYAGAGVDTLIGGTGNDVLLGSGDDKLKGGADNDTYHVIGGDVVTELAGEGTDTVYTELATYRLTPNVENLTFNNPESNPIKPHWGYGNDRPNTITGNRGVDNLYGGNGDDNLYGGGGNDNLYGDAHSDHLYGEDGTDTLYGGAGNDWLSGGAGNDRLTGGEGKDTLTGGANSDTFVFNSTADSALTSLLLATIDSVDTITDFVHGVDKIDLRLIDANAATSANDNFTFLAHRADFHGTDWTGQVWFEQQAVYASDPFGGMGTTPLFATTTVYASTNADSAAEFQVTLNGLIPLTISDFVHPAGDFIHI
jgi:Ca2+-binding RTX toxin-like protein